LVTVLPVVRQEREDNQHVQQSLQKETCSGLGRGTRSGERWWLALSDLQDERRLFQRLEWTSVMNQAEQQFLNKVDEYLWTASYRLLPLTWHKRRFICDSQDFI
jgi:hypothetical protein